MAMVASRVTGNQAETVRRSQNCNGQRSVPANVPDPERGTGFALSLLTMTTLRRAAAVLACVAGLAVGCSKDSNPTSPTGPPSAGAVVYYTAIGASDAIGYGSSAVCIPYTDCPNGAGYVQAIGRQLQGQGSTVTVVNLGIPGAVIGPGVQALANQYNRTVPSNFIDGEVPFVPRNTTLITVFAGGNDVNTIGATIRSGAGGGDPWGFIDQQVKAFGTEYATLIARLKERVPGARIVVANLPNFAAIPMTSGFTLEERQMMQKLSVDVSTQVINPLASQGIPVVDLLCNSQFSSPSIFSADGFHPNDSGYAVLAAEMMKAIMASGVTTPASSCAQMTAVPPR
jgi:lysophospholipase L1-like esterase